MEFERFCSYLSLAMIPVTQTLAQGIFLFWLSSNVYSMMFMFLTRQPRIRHWLHIPPITITTDTAKKMETTKTWDT